MPNKQIDDVPYEHVLAVINGRAAADDVEQTLHRNGFGETVQLLDDDVAEHTDPKGENAGLLGKALKAVQDHLSEQPNYLAQYQEEARNGNTVIAVRVAERDQVDQVRQILESKGAHNLRYFGRLAVTDLTPDTNPSTRSEDSPEVQAEN